MDDRILIHHGIKGMKWGVRNGPPYPLSIDQKSVREKRLAKVHKTAKHDKDSNEAQSSKAEETSNKRRFQLSDKHKRALKIGAAALGVALLAYGGYRLAKSDQLNPDVFLDSQLKRKIAEAADFDTQINDDLRKINRGGLSLFLKGRDCNCTSCSMAYEMRRRGYDVVAGRTTDGRSMAEMMTFFKDAKPVYIGGSNAEILRNTTRMLLADGEGARGIINGSFVGGGGHSIAYEVHNGRVHFVDGQLGGQYKSILSAMGSMESAAFIRTDNLALTNRAAETVRNNTLASWLGESPEDFVLAFGAGTIAYSALEYYANKKDRVHENDKEDDRKRR